MSAYKKDDLIRYNHGGIVYYVRVTETGHKSGDVFCGVIVPTHDTNYTPEESIRDPNKELMFGGSPSWYTVIDELPKDSHTIFMESLDSLEKQL